MSSLHAIHIYRSCPLTLSTRPLFVHFRTTALTQVDPATLQTRPRPPAVGRRAELLVLPVSLYTVQGISSVKLFVPKDLVSASNRMVRYSCTHDPGQRY